jgi:hypothetical protein
LQVVAPATFWWRPGEQRAHASELFFAEKLPTAHAWHEGEANAPENVPATHFMHMVAPATF